MTNIDRYLRHAHPCRGHPGHALLDDSYQSIDYRQIDEALSKLGDAMKSFGWDLLNKRFDASDERRRCWRHWIGVSAQLRVKSFDLVARGALANTTTDQALLNELEELYVDITNARRAEIEPKRRRVSRSS